MPRIPFFTKKSSSTSASASSPHVAPTNELGVLRTPTSTKGSKKRAHADSDSDSKSLVATSPRALARKYMEACEHLAMSDMRLVTLQDSVLVFTSMEHRFGAPAQLYHVVPFVRTHMFQYDRPHYRAEFSVTDAILEWYPYHMVDQQCHEATYANY